MWMENIHDFERRFEPRDGEGRDFVCRIRLEEFTD